jgi:hypothetical protein
VRKHIQDKQIKMEDLGTEAGSLWRKNALTFVNDIDFCVVNVIVIVVFLLPTISGSRLRKTSAINGEIFHKTIHRVFFDSLERSFSCFARPLKLGEIMSAMIFN